MSNGRSETRSGGCQCGAVRFRSRGRLGRPSICHCRMCQKQFGAFFSALVTAPEGGVEWSRGAPAWFRSSINIERGFCRDCGTPLAYRHPGGLELSIGAFDIRDDLAPQIQVNHAARLPWVETIFSAPVLDDPDFYARQEEIISFQHPDHDTDQWPEHGLNL
ncbi:GFA family protein [Shinella pollutisoli]|uniref:GFA family protein n=1 Tax=Shinella pollutisoli TaxID=2250594 RepID=A0ABV7DDZ4_9HYPH|nr:GFA family protein [Shinella pollutisoli]